MSNYQIPDNAVRVEFYRDGDIAYMIVNKTAFLWLYDEVNKAGWCRMAHGGPDFIRIRDSATRCETEHEAVTGRKPDEWISIKEGLPILPSPGVVTVIGYAPADDDNDSFLGILWYGSDGRWTTATHEPKITHWQARPDAPHKPKDQPESKTLLQEVCEQHDTEPAPSQLYKAKNLFKTAVDDLLDAFLKAIGNGP